MKNIISGKHLVFELINSSNRVKEIYLLKNNMDIEKILKNKKIPIVYKDKLFFSKISKESQNIAALVEPFPYYFLKDIKNLIKNSNNAFLILDQIQSPYNFGSLIRSAVACNFKAIIISKNNQIPVNATVEKIAVGCSNKIPIILVPNISNAITYLKTLDFWIYATGSNFSESQDLEKIKFSDNTALILGSEHQGIRPLVLKNSDFFVRIPINNSVESLNVSSAGAILMYQISNQKK